MGVFRFLILLKFITHIEAINSKSVNLALETVLEFNNKDNTADVKFIDNVQQFLNKVKTVIGNNRTARRFDKDDNNIKFTDFLKSAIDIVKTYDDDDLEDVFAVFDDEVRKYHYRGCKFYELVEDRNVRRFVANKLDDVKDKPAQNLRKNLDNAIEAIENSKFNGIQTELLDYVNSLYRQDSSAKFKAFLNNLQTYSSKSKRSNLDLIKVVRDGIRSVIFDHYSALNVNARKDLKIKLETIWRSLKYPDKVERNVWTVEYTSKDLKTAKYNKINDHTDDTKLELTTRTVKMQETNTESKVSSELADSYRDHKQKPSHKKHANDKYVYFNKYNKNYKLNIGFKRSSELSDIDEEVSTNRYILKSKPKKHRDDKSQKIQSKYVTPKKRRHTHKKISSFITLYPEEITFNTKKYKDIESTTQKARLYTLWEETLIQKKPKDETNIKLKELKSNINLRSKIDKPRVISESDTIISVNRAVVSSVEDGISQEHERHEMDSEITKKHHKWQKTKTTESRYKPTTHKKFRKNIPKVIHEEGISIESYEINRRTMPAKNKISKLELKENVLRRINNLEKQMEEVKNKIDTKLTTVDDASLEAKFEPLEFWKGTTTSKIYNNTKTNTLTTKSSTVTIKHNVTEFKTTTQTTKNNSVRDFNKKKDIITDKMNNIKKKQEVTDVVKVNKNDSVINNKDIASLADANEIAADLKNDNIIDNIIHKYNISVQPDKQEDTFDIDKYLDESPNPTARKKEVDDIIEKDMKKIMEGTTKSNDLNEFNDPFQDVNAALDFIRR